MQDLSDTFEAYLVEAHRLKELNKHRIELLVGLETEYIDDEGLDRLEQLLEKHGNAIEYLVGSVHHCDSLPIDFDKERYEACLAGQPGSTERERFSSLFCTYFDNQYTLLKRLQPEVVGHIDLCRLYFPDTDFASFPEVWQRIERNVDFATSYGALFEVNASAFRKGWRTAYPGSDVFDVRSGCSSCSTLEMFATEADAPVPSAAHFAKGRPLHPERRLSRTASRRSALRPGVSISRRTSTRHPLAPRAA